MNEQQHALAIVPNSEYSSFQHSISSEKVLFQVQVTKRLKKSLQSERTGEHPKVITPPSPPRPQIFLLQQFGINQNSEKLNDTDTSAYD